MKYLIILKRFEIWLLLAVVGFVFYSAFRPETNSEEEGVPVEEKIAVIEGSLKKETPEEESENEMPEAEQVAPNFRIESVRVDAGSDAGRIIEVTLLARSDSGVGVVLDETSLRAETDTGAVVPHFFSPFKSNQVVDPEEPSLVTVRFWLEQPAEKIHLFFEGEQAEADLAAKEIGS